MRLDRFMAEALPDSSPTTRRCISTCIATPTPRSPLTISRSGARTTVEFLRGLSAGAGDRIALHKEYGEITLGQMLNEWALHDLGHVRQIAELVRARKYKDGAGAMAASYDLKP